MPYIKPDSASSICFVKNRYRGSGFTLNGFSFSPKKLLYMILWRLRFAPCPLPASLAQYEWPRVPAQPHGNLVGGKSRTARTRALGQIRSLDIRRIPQGKRRIAPERPRCRNSAKKRVVVSVGHALRRLGIPVSCIARV